MSQAYMLHALHEGGYSRRGYHLCRHYMAHTRCHSSGADPVSVESRRIEPYGERPLAREHLSRDAVTIRSEAIMQCPDGEHVCVYGSSLSLVDNAWYGVEKANMPTSRLCWQRPRLQRGVGLWKPHNGAISMTEPSLSLRQGPCFFLSRRCNRALAYLGQITDGRISLDSSWVQYVFVGYGLGAGRGGLSWVLCFL